MTKAEAAIQELVRRLVMQIESDCFKFIVRVDEDDHETWRTLHSTFQETVQNSLFKIAWPVAGHHWCVDNRLHALEPDLTDHQWRYALRKLREAGRVGKGDPFEAFYRSQHKELRRWYGIWPFEVEGGWRSVYWPTRLLTRMERYYALLTAARRRDDEVSRARDEEIEANKAHLAAEFAAVGVEVGVCWDTCGPSSIRVSGTAAISRLLRLARAGWRNGAR